VTGRFRGRHVGLGAVTLGLICALAGCGSSGSEAGGPTTNSPATTPPTSASPAAGAVNANGCTKPPGTQSVEDIAEHQYAHEPAVTTAPTAYTATIVTNCGTIVAKLDGKNAPHTVNSFSFLAGKGYFNKTPCHRLTTRASGISVLQCGDPSGTGTGGPGYTIPDENLKGATYPPGTLAMANTGTPHTGGSQFFFVYAPSDLSADFTPFGHVTSGFHVLRRIAKAGAPGANGPPNQPVVIESFTVTKGAPS
jgi:peptidyl-prolyl cis-trans isomerase B (cyclophilin B)